MSRNNIQLWKAIELCDLFCYGSTAKKILQFFSTFHLIQLSAPICILDELGIFIVTRVFLYSDVDAVFITFLIFI